MFFSEAVEVFVECLAVGLLVAFFWLCPQRNRNPLIAGVYRRLRSWLGRVGLAHSPWTMFAATPNRNHFCLIRLRRAVDEPIEEFRDVWRVQGWWGDLVDERARRIVVAIVRADTGPSTKRSLAKGFIGWCLRERMSPPAAGCEGTVVFGQEVFRSPLRRKTGQEEPEVLVRFSLAFKVGTDGHVEFAA